MGRAVSKLLIWLICALMVCTLSAPGRTAAVPTPGTVVTDWVAADWDGLAIGSGNGGTAVMTSGGGGNPGGSFNHTNTVRDWSPDGPNGNMSSVAGIWTLKNFSYAPQQQGSASVVELFVDARQISGFQGHGFVLRQAGRYYFANREFNTSAGWKTTRMLLMEDDFYELVLSSRNTPSYGPITTFTSSPSSHPDFSSNGEPMQFGIWGSNSTNFFGTGYSTTVAFDNFGVKVYREGYASVVRQWNPAEWERLDMAVGNGGNSSVAGAGGGNPAPGWVHHNNVNQWSPQDPNNTSGTLSMQVTSGFTYDPGVSGAIDSLEISLDHNNVSGLQGMYFLLKQGDHWYSAGASYFLSGGGGWNTSRFTLRASDFNRIVLTPRVVPPYGTLLYFSYPNPPEHPNFYATGEPIRFGWGGSNGTAAFGGGYSTAVALDNFFICVHPTAASGPRPSVLTLNPYSVVGGKVSTGRLTLDGPAPVGGTLALLSKGLGLDGVSLPSSVVVPQGASTVTFPINTVPVASSISGTITATVENTSRSATLTVVPPSVAVLTLNPYTMVGGKVSTGAVTLSGLAPAGGVVVELTKGTGLGNVNLPSSVVVLEGELQATFMIETQPVAETATGTLTASGNGTARTATLTVTPPAAHLLTLNPATVVGGKVVTGSLTLSGQAPAGGITATLTKGSGLEGVTIPASVTVPEGANRATITITTSTVSANISGAISATTAGVTRSATLMVTPPAPHLLTLNPATLVGGRASTGSLTLSGAAPAGGLEVSLSKAATLTGVSLPPSITVPEGAFQMTFTINTGPLTESVTGSISATANGVTRNATLTVTP